jgi:TfoX/Sxy family transcriptional regulator of competence genes
MERADRLIVELVEAAWPEAPDGFARSMFGAVGLKTAKGGSFGIVSDGVLFLKRGEPTTDDSIPWISYEREGRIIKMCYAEIDADIVESPARLAPLLAAARKLADQSPRVGKGTRRRKR